MSSFNFNFFKDYAKFLLNNHLEDLINEHIKYSEEMVPPILNSQPAHSFVEFTRVRLKQFLENSISDTAFQFSIDTINKWKRNDLPNFNNLKSISAQDITLAFSIRKQIFIEFLEKYTNEFNIIKQIILELERFHRSIEEYAFQAYMDVFEKELQSTNEALKANHEELQTLNEELVESQEELQTINEELRGLVIQRIETENALKESELKYKKIVESLEEAQAIAHVGSWEWDIKKNEVLWSAELFRIFGYQPMEIKLDYETYSRHIFPSDVPGLTDAIEQAINQHIPYSIEHRIITKEGHQKWILGKGNIVLSPSKEAIKLRGIVIDITLKKQAELEIIKRNQEQGQLLEELKSAEEYLIKVNNDLEIRVRERTHELETLNSIGKMISAELDINKIVQTVTDVTTELTEAEFGSFFYNIINNKGESYTLYTISGVPKEAFENFPMPRNTEVFSPTFKGEGIVRVDDITKDPRYGQNPPYHGMPEGHLPVRSYLAVPVISRFGEVMGGLFYGHSKPGVFTQKAENLVAGIAAQAAIAIDNARLFEKAQADEQRFRLVLESMPEIAWTADAEGAMDYFNQRYYSFTGRDLKKSEGWGWIETINPEDTEYFMGQWKKSIKTGESFQVEYRMKNTEDNTYRWQLCRALPLKDKDKIIKWFGTCTDINDQKLNTNRLVQANKDLTQVNEFLDTFVYIAAHDLRSPLSNLKMIIDRLNKTEDLVKRKEFLDALNTSVNRLDQTVNGLVKVIEIQSTDPSITKEILFDNVVDMIVEEFSKSINDLQVKIETDFTHAPSIVYIEAYLESVIRNLLGNAVKYHSQERNPHISISTTKENDFTLLTITDNGIGMDLLKYGKNIFKPFTRFSKIADGKGLGLYLVKNMIEKNGGKVELESTPGAETTFKVYLREY